MKIGPIGIYIGSVWQRVYSDTGHLQVWLRYYLIFSFNQWVLQIVRHYPTDSDKPPFINLPEGDMIVNQHDLEDLS